MTTKQQLLLCLLPFMIFVFNTNNIYVSEENSSDNPILIVSSYNPDVQNTSSNMALFVEEYAKLGGKSHITIENMNCQSFSEAAQWKSRMNSILQKYKGKQKPSIIILLGQEAWASFLSQEDPVFNDVPIMSAMTSRNGIILPDESVKSLSDWMPESVDFISDVDNDQLKGGFVYEYDLKGNIELIKKLYPETENIVFISDNSYGGVSLQALVRKEMKNYPDLNLKLIDGRLNTIYTLVENLRELPEKSVVIMGTWRVDKNDGYFIRNATYAMMEATPHIPAISLTTIGFGYWAIGGIMPEYRSVGKEMAEQVVRIQKNPNDPDNQVVVIGNSLRVDYNEIQKRNIDVSQFPSNAIIINKNLSFYEEYKYKIWLGAIIFGLMAIALLVVFNLYQHTNKLKNRLEISGKELLIAKDKAEESDRLKSNFIANMSHEIRTPLNAIVGFSNVLAMGEVSKEEAQAYNEIIQTNSDLLLRLINDILDLSRLKTGKTTFSYEKIDVIQLLRQTIDSVSYSFKTDNKFVFDTEYNEFIMESDPQRLQQVIINLLSNAAKFTTSGTITLSLKADTDKNLVYFSVSDTGVGIPADKLHLVFERFEKLNEYKQGTGLGLSISKLIVEKLGGKIWVDPDYSGGARFTFTHPINRSN